MELSAPGPLFSVHKGSIVQRFSIEPLCRRYLLFALQIARAQKSYVPTLSQIQSYIVHKGSICSDSTFVHYDVWLYKYLALFYLALLKVTRFYQ